MNLPSLGESTPSGDWHRWQHGCGGSESVVLWRPGMIFATCRACGRSWRVSSDKPLASVGLLRVEAPDPPAWQPPPYGCIEYWAMRSRGLSHDEVMQWVVIDPQRRGWAIFPIQEDGVIVAWQARSCDPLLKPKYTSGRTRDGWMRTSDTVWGLDRIQRGKPVYVVEGIIDAIYFTTGVSVLGMKVHKTQVIKILDRRPSEVVLGRDLDAPGDWPTEPWTEAVRWLPVHSLYQGGRYAHTG
jgi:hypothetical protein